MNLKTVSDEAKPRGFLVDLDELYKIPSDTNLIPSSLKKLLKNETILKIRKLNFSENGKLEV